MKLLKSVGYVVIIFCFFGSLLNAQELDLSQILKLAEENSKDLKLAKSELELADAQIDEAWAGALPEVDANVSYNRNFKDPKFYISATDSATGKSSTTELDFSFKNNFTATAEVRQTLLSGKVGAALLIAYLYEDYAKKSFEYQKQNILMNTKISFYEALLSKRVYELSVESESSAKENFNEVNVRLEIGAASEYETLQAEVRWRNKIPLTISAKKNYDLSINNLKSIIDIPISQKLIISGSFDVLPVAPKEMEIDEVLNSRSDYQAMMLEGEMRDKNIFLEFSEHFPTLSGTFTFSYQAQSDDFKIENDYDNYVLGLSLEIPMYSGGSTSARVQKARIEHNQSLTKTAQIKDKIEMDLHNAKLSLNESFERISASEKNVSVAQRAYDIAKTRVENGMATQLELKDSSIFLDQAKISDLQARFDYLKAYYELQLTTGSSQE